MERKIVVSGRGDILFGKQCVRETRNLIDMLCAIYNQLLEDKFDCNTFDKII